MSTAYADAISAYRPANFVPDTPLHTSGAPKIVPLSGMSAENNDINPLDNSGFATTLAGYMKDLGKVAATPDSEQTAQSKESSLAGSIGSYISGVNSQITSSDRQTRDLLSGKTKDTGKVVAAVEEADLALDFTIALTKRLTSAFQSIETITV